MKKYSISKHASCRYWLSVERNEPRNSFYMADKQCTVSRLEPVIDVFMARAATPIGALSEPVQGFPSYEYLSLISTVQVEP